mmetsp:Transcript_9774/g.18710  ORF Transcript_9774/g.18710 Transcript_9774/m.18710 type:complete len:136 (-) Transcript_9774:15-422(-)
MANPAKAVSQTLDSNKALLQSPRSDSTFNTPTAGNYRALDRRQARHSRNLHKIVTAPLIWESFDDKASKYSNDNINKNLSDCDAFAHQLQKAASSPSKMRVTVKAKPSTTSPAVSEEEIYSFLASINDKKKVLTK